MQPPMSQWLHLLSDGPPASSIARLAICITGQARTFDRARTNMAAALEPLRNDSVLFFAMDSRRGKTGVGSYSEGEVEGLISETFVPIFGPAGGVDVVRQSTSIFDTLRRGAALVESHEERRRDGRPFALVMRLRPDTIYAARFPPLKAWSEPLAQDGALWLLSDYLGDGSDSCGPTSTCTGFAEQGACVDDNVGVFTRAVLPYYMSTNWLESCPSQARSSCIECRLGCTMRMANVSVATFGLGSDGFRRSILREDDTHEVELPARALEGFPVGSYDQANGSLMRLDSEESGRDRASKQVYGTGIVRSPHRVVGGKSKS